MDRETRRARMAIPGIVVRDGVRDTVVGELDPDGGSCVDLHGMRARWVLRDRGKVRAEVDVLRLRGACAGVRYVAADG